MPLYIDEFADVNRAAIADLSAISGATSSKNLLMPNPKRKGVLVYNDSTAILYLAYATGASTTLHTVQIAAGAYWEMPKPIYTGRIDGIWAAANGSARITELV